MIPNFSRYHRFNLILSNIVYGTEKKIHFCKNHPFLIIKSLNQYGIVLRILKQKCGLAMDDKTKRQPSDCLSLTMIESFSVGPTTNSCINATNTNKKQCNDRERILHDFAVNVLAKRMFCVNKDQSKTRDEQQRGQCLVIKRVVNTSSAPT